MRAIITALSGILLVGASSFQSATETFVIRAEVDTVAVEQITRTPNTLTGDLHLVEEKTSVHYVMHLRSDGSTETAEVTDEAPNFFTGVILFGTPSVNVGLAGVAGRVVRVPADLLPIIGTSMGLIDQLVRLHSPSIGQTIDLKVLNIRNGLPGRVTIRRLAADSVLVDCAGCMRQRVTEELRVGLSHDGGVEGAARIERHWSITRR
jgi:hypothetical protein